MQQPNQWMNETLYPDYQQAFLVQNRIHSEQTAFQRIEIISTFSHGKVLLLDGIVQLTERDEYIYHEMMAHIPLLAHPKPKEVLIIGGGDGGVAQRVLLHNKVNVTLVEIDKRVIELSLKFFPKISKRTFSNSRLTILNEDGMNFLKKADKLFDIIITDRGDDIGPGQTLYEKKFYSSCKKRLAAGGIIVSMAGVPFMQKSTLKKSLNILNKIFTINTCYLINAPTYIGGQLAVTWSSDILQPENIPTKRVRERLEKISTQYITPELFYSAFVLPKDIAKIANSPYAKSLT